MMDRPRQGKPQFNMQFEVSGDGVPSLRDSREGFEKETQGFLLHVVHDLRSARRVVGISAELLLAGPSSPSDEEFQKTLRRMQDGLAQMDAILAGISNYSPESAGPPPIHLGWFRPKCYSGRP